MFDLKKTHDMTEEQYLWKIGQLVDSGDVDSWASINDVVNTELGIDEDKWRDESSFRKRYQAAKKFYSNCFSKMESNEYQKQLEELDRKLARNTIKYRDERRSWNKQNYTDARFEEVLDILQERFVNFGKTEFPNTKIIPDFNGNASMIVCLSDLHIGQTFSSYWGEYNSDIAKERLGKYLEKTLTLGTKNNVSDVYVVCLGDQLSGNIHKTIEISNKENIIDQMKLSIEYISSFCYELTRNFNHVYFASASGNHTRLQAKDLAQHSERLDAFIAWDVCRTLEHIDNFTGLLDRSIDDGISDIRINGKSFLLIHGDYDTPTKQGYLRLANMVKYFPDYILCGHKHFCSYSEESKFIQSGSLAGSGDDYCIENRLEGSASQMICIINDGDMNFHPIKLS